MVRRKHSAMRAASFMCVLFWITASSCSNRENSKGGKTYRFGVIAKGTIEKTVSSSGNLQPVSTVNVLSEMSGRVEKVNADYNDKVARGQVLVQINTDMLKLQELEALATVKKITANRDLQLLDYQNKSKLAEKGLVSDYELKSAKTGAEVLEAELASANASLSVIETKLKDYAFIKSPIAGIVLARNVDVGQSVVEGSSSNSSSLFTLAENLDSMEIKTKVDELDIASIKKGMDVRFTVEALTDESFAGSVKEVRLVPETTNNVVNYFVMVTADNRSGKLLPGMTAEVTFIESSEKDVFLAPNAALRFSPSSLSAAEIQRKVFISRLGGLGDADREKAIKAFDERMKSVAAGDGTVRRGLGGLTGVMLGPGPGFRNQRGGRGGQGGEPGAGAGSLRNGGAGNPGQAQNASNLKTLWFLNDEGELEVRLVRAGVSDGTNTAITSNEGVEGLKVILQEEVK
jgi:HlyD family secretion protein